MIIQLNHKQLVFIQIIFWLFVAALFFLPIDFILHFQPHHEPHRSMHPIPGHLHNAWWLYLLKFLLLICTFYFNYFYLIPTFFSSRQLKTYFLLSASIIGLISCTPLLFEAWHHGHFQLHPRELHLFIIRLLSSTLAILIPLAYKIVTEHAEADREKTKAELSFLRSQINHHFLFNSLNNIYSLSLQGSPHTPKAIYSLSSIMRHMATATATFKIELQQELNFIHHYIEIQKLRLSENTMLHYTVEGNSEGKTIGPMLLIPFIENCFKHGVSTTRKSEIKIDIQIHETTLELNSRNTLLDQIDNEHIKSGVGLVNVRKRLEFEYTGKHTLSVKSEGGYYKTYLNLHLS
jgi:hypothetical protein